MGLFDKFGGKSKYPDLQDDSPLANQVDQIKQPLGTLMEKVKDPIEIIPDPSQTYVFIGKPPKKFGVVWIEQGEVKNLQLVAKEQGMSPAQVVACSEKLGNAYAQHQEDQRYTAHVGNRNIVVTPSAELAQKMGQIIGDAIG